MKNVEFQYDYDYKWSSESVINNVSGINLFIDGHAHKVTPKKLLTNEKGEETILASTGSKLANFGTIIIEEDNLTVNLISKEDFALTTDETSAEYKQRQKDASKNFSDDFRICGGKQPLRDTSIENHNKIFSTAAGLPHIRIHDFRHTHASLLVNEGINIQEIARRLGHSDVQMTWNTYSHLYPREEERAVEILNRIVPG